MQNIVLPHIHTRVHLHTTSVHVKVIRYVYYYVSAGANIVSVINVAYVNQTESSYNVN